MIDSFGPHATFYQNVPFIEVSCCKCDTLVALEEGVWEGCANGNNCTAQGDLLVIRAMLLEQQSRLGNHTSPNGNS